MSFPGHFLRSQAPVTRVTGQNTITFTHGLRGVPDRTFIDLVLTDAADSPIFQRTSISDTEVVWTWANAEDGKFVDVACEAYIDHSIVAVDVPASDIQVVGSGGIGSAAIALAQIHDSGNHIPADLNPMVISFANVGDLTNIEHTAGSSIIRFPLAGTYTIEVLGHAAKTVGGGSIQVFMWLTRNGNPVPEGASLIQVRTNNESDTILVINQFSMDAGDEIQVWIQVSDATAGAGLRGVAAVGARPEVPSIDLIAHRIR